MVTWAHERRSRGRVGGKNEVAVKESAVLPQHQEGDRSYVKTVNTRLIDGSYIFLRLIFFPFFLGEKTRISLIGRTPGTQIDWRKRNQKLIHIPDSHTNSYTAHTCFENHAQRKHTRRNHLKTMRKESTHAEIIHNANKQQLMHNTLTNQHISTLSASIFARPLFLSIHVYIYIHIHTGVCTYISTYIST